MYFHRKIFLKGLDTHSMAPVGPAEIAVCCGRPESVHVFDVDEVQFKWRLEPTQV